MKITMSTILLAFLLLVFAPSQSSALCWAYIDHTVPCPGCVGVFYSYSSCAIGCVSGDCNPNGGGGQCCNYRYHSAVIYPDGSGDCHGGICGDLARTHLATNGQSRTRGAPLVGVVYRMPGLRYVPDRCAHTYAVIADGAPQSYKQLGGL
jgi:hypothetical protein